MSLLQGAVINCAVEDNIGRAECEGAYAATANSKWKTRAAHISGMSAGI